MKEIGFEHWDYPNTDATDESGFTALPGGYRDYRNGVFYSYTNTAMFWASAVYNYRYVWSVGLYACSSNAYWNFADTNNGFSVRCVKD